MKRLLSLLLCLVLTASLAAAETPAEFTDFAGQHRYVAAADAVTTSATVKTFIDGDTTHFYVPEDVIPGGVIKARYLAVNTPEITGKVEEWGKKAAAFTREKLSSAQAILLQSDNGTWNLDSTGERHLVWVWYLPEGENAYRLLNLELLQEGLSKANATANNRYGGVCQQALNQAKALKKNLYSGQKDPDSYYGEAIELTLRELRTHLQAYNGMKVAFHGVVTFNAGQAVYVEAFDPETGRTYGMSVYYGHGLSGQGLDILSVGNEVRIVGTLQYYEAGGTWQVSGLTYRPMRPTDPGNIQKISSGHSPAFTPYTAEALLTGQAEIDGNSYSLAELTVATTVAVEDLAVQSAYASADGSMTLTCNSGDVTLTVRTEPLYENGALVTPARYEGKTIAVQGVVDVYDFSCQVRVLLSDHITIINGR